MNGDEMTWKSALGKIPSGLFIVSLTKGEQETAMLASWVQQCAFEPPAISVAVRKGRFYLPWLQEPSTQVVVNIVPEQNRKLLGQFGKGFEPGQPAFEGVEVDRSRAGAPVLLAACAYLACKPIGSMDTSDHVVVQLEVIGGEVLSDAAPAVHLRKDGSRY